MGIGNHNEMYNYLLGIKLNNLKNKGKQLKENAAIVLKALYDLDSEKYYDKYCSLSCIYGAFLGDSIGSCCEFTPESDENHKLIFTEGHLFNPGEITDDSEMAISAAFGYIDLLDNESSKISDYIYFYFGVWSQSGPKDIGRTTTTALSNFSGKDISIIKFNYEYVKNINWQSLANGALMRISTFIVYFYYSNLIKIKATINNFFAEKKIDELNELNDDICQLYFKILIEAYENIKITHPNYENGISCSVFALMTLVGMVTKDAKKMTLIFELISKSQKFIDCHNKIHWEDIAKSSQNKYREIIKEIKRNEKFSVYSQMGYYRHALKLSVLYLYKYPDMGENKDKNLYYKIMCEVCDYGGDTDTNCAIVGTMIGPLIGYKNFKKELFDKFITYIPKRRCQFNSAFIYLYVNHLEKKILNKDNNNKVEKNEKKINGNNFNYTALQMIKSFFENSIAIKKKTNNVNNIK